MSIFNSREDRQKVRGRSRIFNQASSASGGGGSTAPFVVLMEEGTDIVLTENSDYVLMEDG